MAVSFAGRSKPAHVLITALLIGILLSHAAESRAQDTVTGAFEGIVSDSQTGASLKGASVEIINQQTGLVHSLTTDYRGRFYQGLLIPGVYKVRVSMPGYQTREVLQRLKITYTGEVVPVPVALDPVPATATPTASPAPAALGVEDTEVRSSIVRSDGRRGGSFNEEEVSTLPVGGTTVVRTFDELTLLLPGIAPPPQTLGAVAGPGVGPGVGSAGQFSVNGLRSRANNFTVDGSDNNDEDIGVRRQGFVALIPQPIESIKEYQGITLLAPAQFGRNIGAQVNAVSKSGGNEWHGSVYSLFNSSQLNACNFFDSTENDSVTPLTAAGRPVLLNGRQVTVVNESGGEDSYTMVQGGFVMGGPLAPNTGGRSGRSLFYFFSGEGQIINATKEESFAVPTVEQRGIFGSGATGLSVDPFSGQPVLSFPATISGDAILSLYPFPNNSSGIYGSNTFTEILPASQKGKVLSGKVDANFKIGGRQQSFTSRYNFTDDFRDIPVTGGALFSSLRPNVRTQNLSNFLNSEISSPGATVRIFNQMRASYGRTRLIFEEIRDREFLRPSRLANTFRGSESLFLLNAPLRVNDTLPGFANVIYASFFNFSTEDILGPVGQVSVAGLSPVGVDVFNFPQRRVNNTYQLADNLTLRAGNHSFTLGADFRRSELNSELPVNARPVITFNGAPQLAGLNQSRGFIAPIDLVAASAPSGFLQAVTPGSSSVIALRYYQHNYFFQDDWRIRPDLSLALGFRYEYNTPPREVNRRIENTFNDPTLDLVPGLRTFLAGRTEIFDADRNNFGPRLGLAYSPDLFGPSRTTVFRAGFGIFFDQALGAVVSQSRNVFPTFLTMNFAGGVPTQSGVGFAITDPSLPFFPCSGGQAGLTFLPVTQPGTLNTLNPQMSLNCLVSINRSFPGGFGFTLPARRFEMPSAYHYAFTYDQQLHENLVASMAYVGTQGRHLLRLTTPNFGPNAFLIPAVINVVANQPNVVGLALGPGQRIDPSGQISGGRPVPTAGAVSIYESSANSRYDSFQVQLRGRYPKNFQYQVAYTLSRALDDSSDIFELAGSPALPQNSFTFAGERAAANFDVRHRFSYNFIYDIPNPHRDVARLLFGGLQLAGAGRFHSGQPFTVNSIFDVNLDGNLTDRLNTTSGLIVTGDPQQPLRLANVDPSSLLAPIGQDGQVPRNSFRAASILEIDVAVVKSFVFSGQQRLSLRADIFNLIDRANFAIPVRSLGAVGFGQAVNTITPARRVQLSLKYSF